MIVAATHKEHQTLLFIGACLPAVLFIRLCLHQALLFVAVAYTRRCCSLVFAYTRHCCSLLFAYTRHCCSPTGSAVHWGLPTGSAAGNSCTALTSTLM